MTAAALSEATPVKGRLTRAAPLAPLLWFKAGGPADWLFEPADLPDLQGFLAGLPGETPVTPLGLGSNLIVRDGGVAGVVIRLGKPFAGIRREADTLVCGGGASGIAVASAARDAGLSGLEFLRGIPGTVGGFVRMNGGAYGRETADALVEADILTRSGQLETRPAQALGYSYRHSNLAPGEIVVAARLRGTPSSRADITAEMDRIAAAREASQPLRTRTGGSTFKNPPGARAWELVDRAGCRGLRVGGAEVSRKHSNFLVNSHRASAADIEALGELVRAHVLRETGVPLEWEIARIGRVQEARP
jgi:UDP-N-acetylmuramate dehydrogenase